MRSSRVAVTSLVSVTLLVSALAVGIHLRQRSDVLMPNDMDAEAASDDAIAPVAALATARIEPFVTIDSPESVLRGVRGGDEIVLLARSGPEFALHRIDTRTRSITRSPLPVEWGANLAAVAPGPHGVVRIGSPTLAAGGPQVGLARGSDGTVWVGLDFELVRVAADAIRTFTLPPPSTAPSPNRPLAPDGSAFERGQVGELLSLGDLHLVGRLGYPELTTLDMSDGRFSSIPRPGEAKSLSAGPSGAALVSVYRARSSREGALLALDPRTGRARSIAALAGTSATDGRLIAVGDGSKLGLLDADGRQIRRWIDVTSDARSVALRSDEVTIVRQGWHAVFLARDGAELGRVSFAPAKLPTRSNSAGGWAFLYIDDADVAWFGAATIFRADVAIQGRAIVVRNAAPPPAGPAVPRRCDVPLALPTDLERSSVSAPQWSPDGSKLLVARVSGRKRSLAILDVRAMTLRDFPADLALRDARWSPTGRRIAGFDPAEGDALLVVVDAETATVVARVTATALQFAWHDDELRYWSGAELRAWREGEIRVLLTLDEALARSDMSRELSPEGGRISVMRWTRDKISQTYRVAEAWKVAIGRGGFERVESEPLFLGWTRDGGILLAYTDRYEWHQAGRVETIRREGLGRVLSWDRDGLPIFTAASPPLMGSIDFIEARKWDGTSLGATMLLPNASRLAFSPDGKLVAVLIREYHNSELWLFRCLGR